MRAVGGEFSYFLRSRSLSTLLVCLCIFCAGIGFALSDDLDPLFDAYGRHEPGSDLAIYKALAERGFVDSSLALATHYRDQFQVDHSEATSLESLRWTRLAAEQGSPQAQQYLGIYYGDSNHALKDAAESAKWYLRAAEQGFELSQEAIGGFYEAGKGVKLDRGEALFWYLLAAAQKPSVSVMRDRVAALMTPDQIAAVKARADAWKPKSELRQERQQYQQALFYQYRMAASAGVRGSGLELGRLYFRGQGVSRDVNEAIRLYRKEADSGFADAQFELGKVYFYGGAGVPRNDVQAYEWLKLNTRRTDSVGAKLSIDTSRVLLETLIRRMSPQQISDAERLVDDWKPAR